MSKKTKNIYICDSCGHQEMKWIGKCPACQEWGTFQETLNDNSEELTSLSSYQSPRILNQVKVDNSFRLTTGGVELDRLLGGGIVSGSVLLLVGDPGIGKSTLSLIIAGNIAKSTGTVLYVSGEESAEQTKIRANRIGEFSDSLYVIAENNLELVNKHITELQPKLVIVDSIQSVFMNSIRATPGSPSQIKESTLFLIRIAKQQNIPIILIGQVTKESQLAGPRVLEHLVDTVLYLEGNRSHNLRVGRAVKNRFGSTNEIALFEMTDHGIEEVGNPSEYLLENRSKATSGSVIVATARGSRPIFTEIQALVTEAPEGIPPRQIAIGIDRNRLLLVTAVLQRWVGERLGNKNIFVSTAGGIESDDPALDLGIAASILSSTRSLVFNPKVFFLGEIALSGEVRLIPDYNRLIIEGKKLGFEECIVSKRILSKFQNDIDITLYGIEHLKNLIGIIPAIINKELN